jgi:F-type H+-transporting ATPase subunit gamma
MSSGQERALRHRIHSIESTEKLTRAMDLISASQITRAQGRIQASRPYVDGIEGVLAITASDVGPPAPMIGAPADPRRVLVVAIVADRGLCGAYNANVLRACERLMRAGKAEGRAYSLITVGRRAQSFFRFHGRQIKASFVRMTERPTYADARRVGREVVTPFVAGEVDLVVLVSTRFRSAGVQVVEVRQLLPLAPAVPPSGEAGPAAPLPAAQGFYDFEPAAEELLTLVVPLFAEAALFGALLEASASEHTARQRAMSAATENADELVTTLRRLMNRIRQDSITNEIMEVVGGAEAMRIAGRDTGSETLIASSSEE